MAQDYDALTEKEKATLRLLVRGHDTKTIARHLDLSVHTINERLRNARQKMSVSSSRQAARLLLDKEGDHPSFLADKILGEAESTNGLLAHQAPDTGHGSRIPLAMLTGVLIMSLILATLAFSSLSQNAEPTIEAAQTEPDTQTSSSALATSDVITSARQWLALVDQFKWLDSWNATGQAFKELNTSAAWASAAGEVQPTLGAVLSRTASSQEAVPAPPHGYEMVKFRTSFENKPNATETLTLIREDASWKVVGYWIE
ncbi:helix-turn-helix domain-containing protein [Parasphingorhabdus cellanae]|uniref:DUF4019 domain-containing protein n=1 Tax=Parasphingorhabdus cellanae TaxID=2806553 RepID=A0ABX7T6P5_9SPHN|nr:DUF4019 domain-containing protein [Parasphingorhabdus cellanae]QTD55633.1 DUF4019 domain-containing protein [Parasphingorhabdus cellanae]